MNKNAHQLLFDLRGADMQLTTDQTFRKVFAGTRWAWFRAYLVCRAGAFNVACAGGLYGAPNKGGGVFIPTATTYAGMSGTDRITVHNPTGAGTDASTLTTLYLCLTTGNTGPLTVDWFIYGYVVD